ncbi:MAG: hypothetical protein JXQ72_12780 [Anaerolineae bacterium]|nr:hypothetical protein [Anaerolineae bacterium]
MSEETAERKKRRVPSGVVLVVMVAGMILAALILVRVAGPLYGLLFPAKMPIPEGADQIEHQRPDKGAEYWIYRTTMTGAEVAAFYEQEGGKCQYTPHDNPSDQTDSSNSAAPATPAASVSYSVAHCAGKKESGGIGLGWEVYIHEGYSEAEGPTIFRIYKYSEID